MGLGYEQLPVGDYLFVRTPRDLLDRTDAVVMDSDEVSASRVASCCVERKTIRDLVGRSSQKAHLKQMRRMAATGLLHLFLLFERDLNNADKETAWGAGPKEGRARGAAIDRPEDVLSLMCDVILRQGEFAAGNFHFIETRG